MNTEEFIRRTNELQRVIEELIRELELKTLALQAIYNENVRRLRQQNQPKGMDQG